MKLELFRNRAQRWVLSLLLPAFALLDSPLQANPTGGVVVHGQATIDALSSTHLQINQQSQATIINWTDFSIGAGEITQFVQPNVNAIALNRVVGGNVSQIHGQLQGNGNVFVINTNGIFIGSSGVVDIAGNLVLSTLDIDDQDFLSGGPSRFYGDSTTGVTNFGTISSAAGDVILLGGFVDNEDGGQIGALNGTVALGSGGEILLEQSSGGGQITVRGASDYTGTGVNNAAGGEIRGAAVEMKAHGNVYALAINNGGAVRATGATRSGGRVRLQASGGSSNVQLGRGSDIYARRAGDGGDISIGSESGVVNVDGSIDAGGIDGGSVSIAGASVVQGADSVVAANGLLSGGTVSMDARELLDLAGEIIAESDLGNGGDVILTGDEIMVQATTQVSADGFSSGGRVRIGGEFQGADVGLREADYTTVREGAVLSADGIEGNGGSVIVWANRDTLFAGDVTASALGNQGNGGLIEVSGKEGLGLGGTFAATAVNGEAGTVLFDPGSIIVGNFAAPGVNEINISLINDTLQKGSSVILATQGAGSNIFFEDVDLGNGQQAGGSVNNGTTFGGTGVAYNEWNHPRNLSIQWTNSDSSFGAFAGGSIFIDNHIRTSGGGSINLVSGWTGLESDFQAGGAFDPTVMMPAPATTFSIDTGLPADPIVLSSFTSGVDVEGAFNSVLENGQFGQNGGSIFVGSATMTRHVEVGSRYGNTNLAADLVRVTGSDENAETRYAQIGFRDSGGVFAPRFNDNTADAFNYDINLTDNAAGNGTNLVVNGKPIVGIVGANEVDINGDGIMDGVRGVNEDGVQETTFIPYANHYNSSRQGNWWWQQIHEASSLDPNNPPVGVNVTTALLGAYIASYDPNDIGGNRPEMGAGSSTDGADINIIATGSVEVKGGGLHGSGAQIGHGGDSSGALENISRRNGSTINTGNGLVQQNWSFNGSINRSANAIARLAPVYGDINVLAGVNAGAGVTRNANGSINATINDTGSVLLEGLQRTSSSNDKTNLEANSASQGAPAWIGHGGVGQFGRFIGDIRVEADGDIEIKAGSNSRGFSAIGHHILTFHDWNPTDVADSQIRFFNSVAEFDIPELRRDAIVVAGGPNIVALDGSVVNEFRGDINVRANGGDVLVKGYDNDASLNLFTYRDLRFAQIGHGGETAEVDNERNDRQDVPFVSSANEAVQLQIRNTGVPDNPDGSISESLDPQGDNQGGASNTGGTPGGAAINRGLTFMTISGDVDVYSSGNLKVSAGNGAESPAIIGHGGHTLADYETSSAIVGDIKVEVGGAIELIGGGEEAFTGVRRDTQQGGRNLDPYGRNFVMIGHGGSQSGFTAFTGDIDVDAVGDITVTGGEFRDAFAKIGHQARRDFGQSGGTFNRTESFIFDQITTGVETTITNANKLTVDFTNTSLEGRGPAAADNLDIDISGHTADVSVISSTGDILLNHKGEGIKKNANQIVSDADPNFASREGNALVDEVYVQIGHGGMDSDSLNRNNSNYNQVNKVGDIEVIATAGNITLENGNGEDRWTRIGHGVGRADRGDITGGESLQMTGKITATAGGSIFVNAAAADANGNIGNLIDSAAATTADTSRWNPVAIGHGGAFDNNGLVVLDSGDVNGIAADATIEVTAGQNLEITGGKGQTGSSAQVGHGYGTTTGNGNTNRVGNVANGFNGDIKVIVGEDLKVVGGENAWVLQELANAGQAVSVEGAYAAIGNGGFQLDAEANGNVQVYVGGNAEVKAQQRTQNLATGTGLAPLTPTENDSLASIGNFASVGHFNIRAGTGAINNSAQSGDVTVVVDGNFDLIGGTSNPTTPTNGGGVSEAPIVAAFAKVGNGGPGINGNVSGNVTVLVKGNLNAVGGTRADLSTETLINPIDGLNNYTQIGNGDRFIEQGQIAAGATGIREGNIVIGVGGNASFDDVLVGHTDPLTSSVFTLGSTTVAVSRNDPFYSTTPGTLTATGDTVFSSGTGGQLKLIMPSRSANLIDGTVRLNEGADTFTNYTLPVGAARDFDSLDGSGTETSGRDDEVFLTPDLWWDAVDLAGSNGFAGSGVFPTDATGGAADQGGSLANVLTPGGFPNLDSLSAGALGSSATTYRGGNGVSGSGNYTLYYDALEVVAPPSIPPPPAPVFPGFDFAGAIQDDPQRLDTPYSPGDELLDNEIAGGGVFGGLLGLNESDDSNVEENRSSKLENTLDDLFGPRRDSSSAEETDEERRARRNRGRRGVGMIGLTYYAFDPGTNQYSSYRVFGTAANQLYPAN